jgi:hypothetical protein
VLEALETDLSAKTRTRLAAAIDVLDGRLRSDEAPGWLGYVMGEGGGTKYAFVVTDQRLLLANPKRSGHWEALEIPDLAQHGVLLARDSMITIAAQTASGLYRRELRPLDPPTFAQIPWSPVARTAIDSALEASDALRSEGFLRRLFRRRRS